MQQITILLEHYGYIILFLGLLLELIALPTPGELLMSYCGFLVYQHRLNWPLSILISSAGAIIGITISYSLGHVLGNTFFLRHGSKLHMGPERMEKLSGWFTRYGNKLLIVAYFIPGVRHVTGYFSGITRISYRKFAIPAYLGAFIWTSTFISLGRVLGTRWQSFHGPSRKYLIIGGLSVSFVLLVYYLYKYHRTAIIDFILRILNGILGTYHSLGRLRAVITLTATALMGLLILIAGLIQDFLANEFNQFDMVVSYIIRSIFPDNWFGFMDFFITVTSSAALFILSVLALIWVVFKGVNKLMEARFLLVTVIAGQFLQEGLGFAFHRLGPITSYIAGKAEHVFPDEQTFLTVVVFGAAAYLILRHMRFKWLRPVIIAAVVLICLFTGISEVFLQPGYPSDIAAGYAFGGAWLSSNIILLEVLRKLPVKQGGLGILH